MKDDASQLTQPCYQLVHSNQTVQIKFAPHSIQTNYHSPSKTTSPSKGGKQGERRRESKMEDNHIERRQKEERGEELQK